MFTYCLREIMKAKIRLYKNDGEKEQGFPVKIILSHNRKTSRKAISYSKEYDWNESLALPNPSHPDYEDLYDTVSQIHKKSLKQEFANLTDFDNAYSYLLERQEKKVLSFYDFADERIAKMRTPNKQGKVREGNARAYQTAVNQLKEFAPHLTFEQLTSELLEAFKEHKREDGVKNTTLKNYISEIRAIYNTAVRKKIIKDEKPFAGIFHDVKVRKRRAANAYFTKETINQLKRLELKGAEQRTLDLTLLQFYLGGASLADIFYLKNEYIVKDRIFFPTREKLTERGSPFDVKIFPCAWEIINRYRVDGEYVFPWAKDYDRYKSFRENFNKRYLRNIQKKFNIELEPQGGKITSKVIRHTFATLGKFERIEEDLLRELMGHERNEIDTVYKDKYPQDERDAAQLRIIG